MKRHEYTREQAKTELDTMTNRELVAYHNILTMGSVCLMSQEDRNIDNVHLAIVCELLTARKIPHQSGKLIKTK